ncbi:MAG: FAA hydrolase family protein [Alphaproteobacteria bacterium]|nr:MAG: FAA hydrolase family protein [Alphaproteobacteria bacterium]
MKILRFDDERIGILKDGDLVADISDVISHRDIRGPQGVMEELIGNFESYKSRIEDMVAAAAGVPLAEVTLLAPVPRPSRCLAAFVNYLDNPERTIDNLPNEFFHKAPELVGPGGTVVLPDMDQVAVFQAEAELAYVIGRHAKHVAEADAMDHVFGYLPFFDISARGMLRRSQFLPKGQDTFAPAGPWITTKDEIADPHDLRVRSWVNDEARQDYNTKTMAHQIPDQVAWLSRFVQLRPADVIATGTYHTGLGPVNPGDTIHIEIEGLGRASFAVAGDGPRKEPVWDAAARKASQILEPGLSITRV